VAVTDRIARVHYELIRGLIDEGACPSASDLAGRIGLELADVQTLLRELQAIHGAVLHPHVCEPWIVHPFSSTPTLNWIEGRRAGWWAPCVWCAFGVAALVKGEVRIHTRLGAESEPIIIPAAGGVPTGSDDLVVHFAIPPANAWDNVHQHCALVLPFRSAREIREWCERHRQSQGEVVPLAQVARLAQVWYGSHAAPDWHKWTIAEAQQIFQEVGLTSAFWDLGGKRGRF
jgi:hypothetical protein